MIDEPDVHHFRASMSEGATPAHSVLIGKPDDEKLSE